MSGLIKSAIWQGIVLAVVIQVLLVAFNLQMVLSMISYDDVSDFQYYDSYLVIYHGILEDTPKLALLFWSTMLFILSILFLGIVKWVWRGIRSRFNE